MSIKVKDLRDFLKVNQKEFGRILGVSRITVGNWETRNSNPSLKSSYKIIRVANSVQFPITLEEIMSER